MASYYVPSKTCAIKGANERARGPGALMSLDMLAGVSRVPGEPLILFSASLCLPLPPSASCCLPHLLLPPAPPAASCYCVSHNFVRHHPLSHTFRLEDGFKNSLPHTQISQLRLRVSRCCNSIGRYLKRQGFASIASQRCRFFAAIAPAPQRGMTPENP